MTYIARDPFAFTAVCLLALGFDVSSGSQWPSIKQETITKINSETLPGNLLPGFLFMQGDIEGGSIGVNIGGGRGEALPFTPDDSCHDDIFEGANEDLRSPQLLLRFMDMQRGKKKNFQRGSWRLMI